MSGTVTLAHLISPTGANVTAPGSRIIDQWGHTYELRLPTDPTRAPYVIWRDGVLNAASARVTRLYAYAGWCCQLNSDGNWWYCDASGNWVAWQNPTKHSASPSGTIITGTDAYLWDNAGRRFNITPGRQIAINDTLDPITANVKQLQIKAGPAQQVTNSGGVWNYGGTPGSWTNVTPAPPPPPPPQPIPASGLYKVSNGRIYAPDGTPFRARGVNVCYTRAWGDGSIDIGRVTPARLLAAFPGLSFVRFACWRGALPSPQDAAVIAWVNALTAAGVVVEIELHYTGNAVAASDATANAWLSGMAGTFKGNPRVWYGTQNEPHGGGAAISAMMKGQHDAIRAVGATAPVMLCCGDPMGEITSMDHAAIGAMSNVAWDMHYYSWMLSNGMNWAPICSALAAYQSKDGAIPVICAETGDGDGSSARGSNWQSVLQQSLNNPGGFAAWVVNWVSDQADCLWAAPFDGSVIQSDYGQLVANAIRSG